MGFFFIWLERWFGMVKAFTTVFKPNFKNGFQINGSDYTAAELNTALGGGDPGTAGTVTASKSVIVDSNKDISIFRNLSAVNLDAGASGTVGTVDIFPTTASKGKIQIAAADSAGNTTTTITNASQAAARTYTIPDAGASAEFVMTTGAQTISGKTSVAASALQAGASGTVGVVNIYPSTASRGYLSIGNANATGDTGTSWVNGAQAAARTYTVPDASTSASTDTNWQFAMMRLGNGAPSGFAAAQGSLYVDTANGKLYVCTTASATSATFALVGTQS